MAIASRRLTLDQFLELPEEKPALEFVDQVVTRKVPPKGKHSRLQTELVERLNQAGRPHKLALAFTELRTTFGGASRVPDVSVYLWNRIPLDATGQVANDFREPPDIAIEIASPEQRGNALTRRCLWYTAHGVRVALLVDPLDESVLAFRPGQAAVAWRGPDYIDMGDVLPDFRLTVAELFASLRLQ